MAEYGGASGLFRGLAMSCGREGVFTAGMLGLGPTLKRTAVEAGYDDGTASMMSAIGGGVPVALLSHPMDTIKTCMQGDLRGKEFGGGVVQTARTLYAQAGPARFFNGWTWRTGRMVFQVFAQPRLCSNAVQFTPTSRARARARAGARA